MGEKRTNRDKDCVQRYTIVHVNAQAILFMQKFQHHWRTIYNITFDLPDGYTNNFISGDGSTTLKC